MKWYGNLKTGIKLALAFGLVIVLVTVLAVYSTLTSRDIDSQYSYVLDYPQSRYDTLMEINKDFVAARRALSHMSVFAGMDDAETSIGAQMTVIDNMVGEINTGFESYKKSVNSDPRFTDAEKSERIKIVDNVLSLLAQWRSDVVTPVVQANLDDNRQEVIAIAGRFAGVSNDLVANIDELNNRAKEIVDAMSVESTDAAQRSILILAVISVAIIVIAIVLAVIITVIITKAIKRLVALVSDVARGNLNVNTDRAGITKDEIGGLTLDVYKLVDVIKEIIGDISRLTHVVMDNGDYDKRIDTGKYTGSYLELTSEINNFTDNYVDEVMQLVTVITQIGIGNFNAEMKKLPGKKADINSRVESLQANLKNMSADMRNLAKNAADGKLNVRAEADKYKGDWASILVSLNYLVEVIAAPIHEAATVLHEVSVGNFEHKMQGSYQGDFLIIKESINKTVTNVASYINEISEVLNAMAHDDLNQDIKREYVGKFSDIKEAINNIIIKFNRVISDIYSAADQVNAGSKQIAESSMTLAEGASEQAASVEELNATILTINESTTQNAESARLAESLSDSSKKNAVRGDQDMNNMLSSMDGIKESSNSISKIIKVIEDIAFQTNLLALNAAVEAARAGEHGKGFAVVAEEVRNLASRSQNAAKETAGLIDESINRVNEGTEIAAKTAEALRTIISDVTKVADIITNISEASQEQAAAINQVTEGVSQIAEVLQNNSATSEESASASQQLSGQAEVLKSLVNVFSLKDEYRFDA